MEGPKERPALLYKRKLSQGTHDRRKDRRPASELVKRSEHAVLDVSSQPGMVPTTACERLWTAYDRDEHGRVDDGGRDGVDEVLCTDGQDRFPHEAVTPVKGEEAAVDVQAVHHAVFAVLLGLSIEESSRRRSGPRG